ncbi:hypothetical protein [Legionella erythra]|nr:hypothetical protein [Legionella erythra]
MRNLKNAVSANSMVMSSLLKHSFCRRAVLYAQHPFALESKDSAGFSA